MPILLMAANFVEELMVKQLLLLNKFPPSIFLAPVPTVVTVNLLRKEVLKSVFPQTDNMSPINIERRLTRQNNKPPLVSFTQFSIENSFGRPVSANIKDIYRDIQPGQEIMVATRFTDIGGNVHEAAETLERDQNGTLRRFFSRRINDENMTTEGDQPFVAIGEDGRETITVRFSGF